MRRSGVILAAVAGTVAAWQAMASLLFVWVLGYWTVYPWPGRAWMWARYLVEAPPNAIVHRWLIISAVVAALPALGVLFLVFRPGRLPRHLTPPRGGGLRPLESGVTDNHGHAAWASPRAILDRFGRTHGCLIGALDRSPDSPLLFDDPNKGPGHCMSIAGPGSDKTSTLVNRVWHWHGSRVVFDPSCQIAPIMAAALEREGCNVTIIGLGTGGIDILDWIDITDPEAEAHIETVVNWIYDEGAGFAANAAQNQQGRDPYWANQGRAMVLCLMAHMLFDPDPNLPKTVATLRLGIAQPEDVMKALLRGIHASSHSRLARQYASGLMGIKAEQTFSCVYSNAFGATRWLSTSVYANVVSADTIKTAAILDPRTVLFVQIPLPTLQNTPAVGRTIMGALFNAMLRADGHLEHKVLFEIDEAATLGPMKEILLFHRTSRKYHVVMHTIWLSEAELEETWGVNGATILRDCLSWRSYNAIQDGKVAERLSHDIGEYGVMAWSEGVNTGQQRPQFAWFGSKSTGDNVSAHEIKRRLILAPEILRAPADEMYVLARDFSWSIKCCTSPYYRYPRIAKRMSADRFARQA